VLAQLAEAMAVSHRALLRAAEDGRLKQAFRQLLWHRGLPRVSAREPQYHFPPPQSFTSPTSFKTGEEGNFRRGGNVAPFFDNPDGSMGFPDLPQGNRQNYGNNQGHVYGYSK